MTAWTDCINNSYGFDTLLQALLNQYTENTNLKAFRIHVVSVSDSDEVITCSSRDTWFELFRQALVLESDGEVSLAVAINTQDFESLSNCGVNESLDELLRMSFFKTETG
ncbi:hypothetical protein RZS08_11585, partial [Arthrospira platensis SPKY1]|nr:hypothetical protein [Arthrospira platensis SPKY1]